MAQKVARIEVFSYALQCIVASRHLLQNILLTSCQITTPKGVNNDIFFRCFRHVFSIGRRVFLSNKYAVVDKKPIFIHYDAILWIKTGNIIRPVVISLTLS